MTTGRLAEASARRSAGPKPRSRTWPQPAAHAHAAQGPEPRAPGRGRSLPPSTRERLAASFVAPLETADVDGDAEHADLPEEHEPAPTARGPEPPAPALVEPFPELEAEESAAIAAAADLAKQQVAARAARARPDGDAPLAQLRPASTVESATLPVTEPSPVERMPDTDAPARTVEAVARGPPPAPSPVPVIQTKLTTSRPGGALEREADAVAARVARGERRAAQPGGSLPPIRGPPPPAYDRTLPRTVASVVAAPGGGSPLDAALRARIEPHVGVDLGHVRIRDDPAAAAAARDLHARAFTSGSTIFLAAGASPRDVSLIAHEATHVAQQQTSAAARTTLMRDVADYLPDISVDDLVPDWILDGVRSAVRAIPGYTLLTYVTGTDPLTDEPVTVGHEELIDTLLTYGPFGAAVGTVLQAIDVLGEIFAFVSENLDAHDLTLARITRDIDSAWDELSVTNGIAGNVAIVRRYVDAFLRDVRAFVGAIVDRVLEIVRSAVAEVAEPLLETPEIAPLWSLAKKVMRYDPLRGVDVEAPTVEIIADFLRLIGEDERLAQMEERGTLQETADWLDTQLAVFAGLVVELGTLFSDAWAAIQPENLPDLLTNLEALAQRAFGFVQRVGEFAATIILKILELIKDALLAWLSEHAHSIPGFHLLTVILERNPFTGEAVPRTAENLIKGFITLLPGGEETYAQLAEAGVISSAAERIESAMTRLGISWDLVTSTFLGIWDTLSLDDLLDPIGAFGRVLARFGEPLARIVEFVGVVIEVVVTLILRLMNFPSDLLGSIIANALQAIEDIQRDPVGFLLNMLEAVALGFAGFFDNILTYLMEGLVDWLFRGLRELGITIPTDFSLGSILNLVLEVLGITVELLWEKLGEHIGPERVEMIRSSIEMLSGAWSFIRDVQEGGVGAVWRYVTDRLGELWDTLLNMARDWIMETIVRNVTAKLLSMLDPTGVMAVVNSFIAFFNAVQSAIEYLREILEIIDQYVQTFAQIAAGNIVPGAQMLERGLANAIPIAIGFLANQVGLGNVPEKIVEIIQQLRELVDQALDWLFAQAIRLGQAALRALGMGREEEAPAAEPAADGQWIYENPEGGHIIRISPSLEVFEFSDPTLLAGEQAEAQKQAALESEVLRTPLTYPTDGHGRASGPSGFIESIKEGESRASMPPVSDLPGGLAAYEPGDVRGHLIGDRFYGPATAGNLVPMHTTLNGSSFLSYETRVANAFKAAKTTTGAAMLSMAITPVYPPGDPAAPGAKFRPTSVTASSTVYSLSAAGGSVAAAEQTFPGSFANPSNEVVIINLNTASREAILAAYSGTLSPNVHRVVEAILAVRPKRDRNDFVFELATKLDADKIEVFGAILDSRAARFVIE